MSFKLFWHRLFSKTDFINNLADFQTFSIFLIILVSVNLFLNIFYFSFIIFFCFSFFPPMRIINGKMNDFKISRKKNLFRVKHADSDYKAAMIFLFNVVYDYICPEWLIGRIFLSQQNSPVARPRSPQGPLTYQEGHLVV